LLNENALNNNRPQVQIQTSNSKEVIE